MHILTIKDETALGNVLHQIELAVAEEIITVRELIRQRVFAEVDAYNHKADQVFHGLVQPAEVLLNAAEKREKRFVDAEKQFYVALDAFQKNGFFILVDDRQAESLDEEILVTKDASVSFVKLTQLVGG
ncbi:MAG: hypothetical protein AAB316_13475 [Bacteroidota bacterium]